LEEVLELLNEQNDNKLYFILQNLEDCIKYEQDRINHKNKLNDIIEELISYISENANDIKNVASELLNTYKEETPQDQVDNIVKEK
jgi:endonuclease III